MVNVGLADVENHGVVAREDFGQCGRYARAVVARYVEKNEFEIVGNLCHR